MSQVTPIHGHQQPAGDYEGNYEQTTFEGVPVVKATYRLRGNKPQPTDQDLRHFQAVSGVFTGRVVSIELPEIGEGKVGRVHVVEVLEAKLD